MTTFTTSHERSHEVWTTFSQNNYRCFARLNVNVPLNDGARNHRREPVPSVVSCARHIFRERVRKFSRFGQLIRNNLMIMLTGVMETAISFAIVRDFEWNTNTRVVFSARVTRIFLLDRVRKLHKFDLLILTKVTSDHVAKRKRRFLNN